MFEMSLTYDDITSVRNVVNIGIDSRLEGFTKSSFEWNHNEFVTRLDCQIHPSEMQILIRRLLEDGSGNAEMLADSIVYVEYGYETI
jgi:hypothetical protein